MHDWRIVVATLAISTLGGCAGMDETPSSNASSAGYGVSSSGSTNPVWLAAPRPGLSAVGKDYLFFGPMSVNRQGSPQNYLWFAIGTTIDRHLTGAPTPTVDTVVLQIDGTPMTFDLIPWDDGSRSSPYELTIESYASYAARVTDSQMRKLANANVVDAYVTDADGRSPIYSVVAGGPGEWLRF